MATQTAKLVNKEDPFLKNTAQIRQELETRFKEYHLSLDKRQQELSAELDTAEREYKKNRLEHEQKLCAIEQIQASIRQQTESFKAMENSLLFEINKQRLSIEQEYSKKDIQLLLDPEFNEKIQNLGNLKIDILLEQMESSQTIVKSPKYETEPLEVKKTKLEVTQKHVPQNPTPPALCPRDYSKITDPIMTAVKQGDRDCDLKFPQRVAVDSVTGNIYIADQTSHCVKVYNQQGEYLSFLGQRQIDIELVHPYGVCIYKNSIYITSLMEQTPSKAVQPFILKFDRVDNTFQYSKSCGVHGSSESVFKRLTDINADQENGDIYVCDEGYKIHVLDKNLNYKRFGFNQDNIVDFQVKDDFVYVLSHSSPSSAPIVFVMQKFSGILRRRFSLSQRYDGINGLCLDYYKSSFIIIVSSKNNYIQVSEEIYPPTFGFSEKFKILKFLTTKPSTPADDGGLEVRGITTDLTTQKIIVVQYSKDNMLQIY